MPLDVVVNGSVGRELLRGVFDPAKVILDLDCQRQQPRMSAVHTLQKKRRVKQPSRKKERREERGRASTSVRIPSTTETAILTPGNVSATGRRSTQTWRMSAHVPAMRRDRVRWRDASEMVPNDADACVAVWVRAAGSASARLGEGSTLGRVGHIRDGVVGELEGRGLPLSLRRMGPSRLGPEFAALARLASVCLARRGESSPGKEAEVEVGVEASDDGDEVSGERCEVSDDALATDALRLRLI